MSESEPVYHLLLGPDEAGIVAQALRLLISDEVHEPAIRTLAREVLQMLGEQLVDDGLMSSLPSVASARGDAALGEARIAPLTLTLTPRQMKITHTAAKLLLDDSQRDQNTERQLLWSILDKLPDEHSLRAVQL